MYTLIVMFRRHNHGSEPLEGAVVVPGFATVGAATMVAVSMTAQFYLIVDERGVAAP